MASIEPCEISTEPRSKKLPRLSPGFKISKRPLLHPAITSRNTSSPTSPQIIYISSKSSFIGTIKRVRVLLDRIRSRSFGGSGGGGGKYPRKDNLSSLLPLSQNDNDNINTNDVLLTTLSKAIQEEERKGNKIRNEEVRLKASGKAIEKGLRLAAWWSSQSDVKVQLRTGSTGAIDDIVDDEGVEEGSRLRNISYLEVVIQVV
ncbi:putative alba domain containing protein [Erysiphe neolycopersici]|uniref:Putative alba domain containing protein n=1 Tax=Erysiphe neolycopersici TaxID=212602 RepID=A0A420HMS2_9PEZI|nr:putative alba domain containing protein [Erysiphe neolycopersici]